MIPAAVEKCEDQKKPEAFFGYRKAEERQTEDLRVPGPIPGEPTIWENARAWSNGADCKSVAARLRWFKSNFSHHKPLLGKRLASIRRFSRLTGG